MESADLRIFQAVAREGSITKAALLLGYVQSNVTARIRHLESELGTLLFHRHHRGITLSSSGKMLLTYADKIVGLLDEAAQALTPSSEPSGPLLIGSTQTTAAVRLPTLLGKYYEQHPKVTLSLTTDLSNKLIEKVVQYELDVAFINNPCNHPDLQTIPAFNEEVVLVSAPWVTEIEEALTKPNLVYSKGCPYRETLEQWLHSQGVSHLNTMEFGTLEAIIGGVSAGLGITLLPRVVIHKQEQAGAVLVHEVPEAIRYRQTVVIIRKNSFTTSALQAFIQMLEVEEGVHS
ncbi:LysR family transcriptional regulator [Paenibacillus puldeungensis]|uniref:LysR family transcriptional regulator n=1 Tax=Paenibacillus puldeungensis TaxID=696536 RepID=A0ABW3RYP4_9BACL